MQIQQPITSIDQVIDELNNIIEWSIQHNSRIGYFTVLYHRVTCRIKEGILSGEFEDGKRMEQLDILFATRYINAWREWIRKETPTHSWEVAFEATKNTSTIILQHMLLGINAHINLDLGIATNKTMQQQSCIEGILHDFDTINSILASLVDEVEKDLSKVSPMIWLVQKIGKGYEDKLANFSIDIARTGAWYFGSMLHVEQEKESLLQKRDQSISSLGKDIAKPNSKILRSFVWLASLFEWRQPKDTIEKLRYVVKEAAENSIEKMNFSHTYTMKR